MEDGDGGWRWRMEMEDGDGGWRWRMEMEDGDGGWRWRMEMEDGDGGTIDLNRIYSDWMKYERSQRKTLKKKSFLFVKCYLYSHYSVHCLLLIPIGVVSINDVVNI